MHKLRVLALLSVICITCIFISPPVSAATGDVVISQIYVGAVGDSTQEFISVYNNSDHDIDISNWCISNKNIVELACFAPLSVNITLHLPSHTYATISSDSFAKQNIYKPDIEYLTTNSVSGSIVASSDNLTLFDSQKQIVNNVCWPKGETCSLPALSSGSVWQRQLNILIPDTLLDTGAETDFAKTSILVIPLSGIEEQQSNDICLNIGGTQENIPDGYTIDDDGDCTPPPIDVCKYIEGTQLVLPPGYEFDENGECQPDFCLNIDDLQLALPDGYKKLPNGDCALDLLPLWITELLPDAIGSDDGNEFIEIYNPNDIGIDLANYFLDVGLNYEHTYNFPIGSHIGARQYLKFTNDDIKFTLLNSSSRVRIRAVDDSYINETIYDNPDSGNSWALVDNIWQYTNQPTPGNANLSSLIEQIVIIKPTAKLTPCKDGQYRSEETNRCRNIVSDVADLVPCAEGQERNPATNRCRSVTAVLSASDLKPCEANQERNPETNRCRNITSMPVADYKPEQTNENSNNDILYWSLASVGIVAVGYGVWEWRTELARLVRKILKRSK